MTSAFIAAAAVPHYTGGEAVIGTIVFLGLIAVVGALFGIGMWRRALKQRRGPA